METQTNIGFAMKISMHNWMRHEPIETTLDRLHRLGYDGIEISGADLELIQVHGAGLTPAADYDRATRDNITHLKECLASAAGPAQ